MTITLPLEQADLVLCDDFLPTDFSAFRWIEYTHYFNRYDTAILSTEGWRNFPEPISWDEALARSTIYHGREWRVQTLAETTLERARLGYVTFIVNASAALPFFRSKAIPFVLQLYPGGGFGIDQPRSDAVLRDALDSGLCRRVIATQTITRDYLISRIGWPPDRIAFIWGGVFSPAFPFDFWRDKQFYPRDKGSIDVSFVAHKYGANMSRKGYDAFVAVSEQLVARGPSHVRFHVVGGFTIDDLPLSARLQERIRFYGRLTQPELADFFRRMDVIVSMNEPFSQVPGGFDGFPTGSCIEAGFQGVLNCINDPLNLNIAFEPGKEVLLVHRDPAEAAEALLPLIADPAALYEFAERNCVAFWREFDSEAQLAARTGLIDAELAQRVETTESVSGGG